MKFALCSDLHLEFGNLLLNNTEGADVLVLSGDICIAKDLGIDNARSHQWMNFFLNCSVQFKDVIYIMGNHEHYHGDFAKSYDQLKVALKDMPNIHVLEKETIKFGDVNFVCGTLWTDMNKEDPITLEAIGSYMNDYRIIEDSTKVVYFRDADGNSQQRTGKFSQYQSVEEHKAMMKVIADVTEANPDEKWVVVGHHAPSKLSTKPRYQDDVIVNGAYSSDLSDFMLDHPQIKVWTHGHTHDPFDYMIGETRIVCNPRGYANYEDIAGMFKLKYIEV